MNTNEKITLLQDSMIKERDNGKSITYFSDTAPEELVNLFLKNYSVDDIDYEIFSDAIYSIIDNHSDETPDTDTLIEKIQGNGTEFASIYTATRLSYVDNGNDNEISEIMRDYQCISVSQACAIWYDKQVHEAMHVVCDGYLFANDEIK